MLPSFFTNILCHSVSHMYPAIRTFRILQKGSHVEMKPWLTYWTVLGLLHCTEYFTDTFIFWFPFYSEAKLMLRLWLVFPEAQGSVIVYDSYVKPVLARNEPSIQALEKVNRDAVQVLQAVLPQGITRLFEILAKYQAELFEFWTRQAPGKEAESDFEDIQHQSGVKIILLDDDGTEATKNR